MPEQQTQIGKLESLYNNLKKDNYDLPAFDTFKADMQDESKLKNLHSTLVKDNYELPEFGKFKSDMGIGVVGKDIANETKSKTFPKLDESLFEIKGGAPKSEIQPGGAEMQLKFMQQQAATEERKKAAINNQIKRHEKKWGASSDDKRKWDEGFYRDQLKSGDIMVTKDERTGEYILAYANTNPFTAILDTYNKGVKRKQDDLYFEGLSTEDKIKHQDIQSYVADDTMESKPSGVFGKTGEFIGETINMLEKPILYGIAAATGNEFAAGASSIASAKSFGSAVAFMDDMANSSYSSTWNKVYNGNLKGIQAPTTEQKTEAAKKAEEASQHAKSIGAIEGALFGIPFGNLNPELSESAGGYLNMLIESGKHTIKELPKLFGISTVAQIGKGEVAQQYGSGESQKQIFSEGIDAGEGAVKMAAGMFGLSAIQNSVPHAFALLSKLETSPSKALDAKATAVVSKFDEETIKKVYKEGEDNGVFPPGTGEAVVKKVRKYKKAAEDVPKTVKNVDAKDALTGKLEKRNALEEELKTTKIKARKTQIQQEIDQIDKETDNIYNGGNILENEYDIAGNPLKSETIEPTEVEKEAAPSEDQYGFSKKTDKQLESRYKKLESSERGTPEKEEFYAIQKELDRRELKSVLDAPIEDIPNIMDKLEEKEGKPNVDFSDSKKVANKYSKENISKLKDKEIIKDFVYAVNRLNGSAVFYSEGLKVRETMKEAAKRNIDLNDEYIKNGGKSEDVLNWTLEELGLEMPKKEAKPIKEKYTQTKEGKAADKQAKDMGFNNVTHAINSVNEALGTDYKTFQEIKPEQLQEAIDIRDHNQAFKETVKGTEYEKQAGDIKPSGETATGATGEVSGESEKQVSDISHTEAGFRSEDEARAAYESDTERGPDETYEEWKFIKYCGEI